MTLSKDHLYIIFCAFITFCGGLLVGIISGIGASPFELFFSAISSISTLGLLIAGVFSYTSWKKHINYGYLYQSAKSMYLIMSECTTLYMKMYFKLQEINDPNVNLADWEKYVKATERDTETKKLLKLVHDLHAEMQTLEMISSKDDYQACFESVNMYSQLVLSLSNEIKRLRETPNFKKLKGKNNPTLGNLVFVHFRKHESDIKKILRSFINKH